MRAGGEKDRKRQGLIGDSMAGATDWFWTKAAIKNKVLLIK